MNRTTFFLRALVLTLISWTASACIQDAKVESNVIELQNTHREYRAVVNNTLHDIELLPPMRDYHWEEGLWVAYIRPMSVVYGPDFYDAISIPAQERYEDQGNYKYLSCSLREVECRYFTVARYVVSGSPETVYAVYSNEGRVSDPSKREQSITISPSTTEPFHFSIFNNGSQSELFLWSTLSNCDDDYDWSQESRLERQSENGTWEMYHHSVEICEDAPEYGNPGIEIPPNLSISIDGTRGYPQYTNLPPGVYRWVINVSSFTIVFSPRFYWDGATIVLQD